MKLKKIHVIKPKKSDAKKQKDLEDSKSKSSEPKQIIKKKLNEFGDTDSL